MTGSPQAENIIGPMEIERFVDALDRSEYPVIEVGLRGILCQRNNNAGEAPRAGLHRQ